MIYVLIVRLVMTKLLILFANTLKREMISNRTTTYNL